MFRPRYFAMLIYSWTRSSSKFWSVFSLSFFSKPFCIHNLVGCNRACCFKKILKYVYHGSMFAFWYVRVTELKDSRIQGNADYFLFYPNFLFCCACFYERNLDAKFDPFNSEHHLLPKLNLPTLHISNSPVRHWRQTDVRKE